MKNFDVLNERLDAHIALWAALRKSDQRALVLQAKEYRRRLSVLNHDGQRAESRNLTYVPRELHDQEFRRIDLRIDQVTQHLESKLEANSRTREAQIANLSRLVYIGMGIVIALNAFLMAVDVLWKH